VGHLKGAYSSKTSRLNHRKHSRTSDGQPSGLPETKTEGRMTRQKILGYGMDLKVMWSRTNNNKTVLLESWILNWIR